jgi:hypothetical protein
MLNLLLFFVVLLIVGGPAPAVVGVVAVLVYCWAVYEPAGRTTPPTPLTPAGLLRYADANGVIDWSGSAHGPDYAKTPDSPEYAEEVGCLGCPGPGCIGRVDCDGCDGFAVFAGRTGR